WRRLSRQPKSRPARIEAFWRRLSRQPKSRPARIEAFWRRLSRQPKSRPARIEAFWRRLSEILPAPGSPWERCRKTARRDVSCNVSDLAMLRLYQISLPSLTVLTNNPRLYSAVSAVRAGFDSGILGHILGHLLVDSKGLVPESRNSHIVLWTL